MRGRIYSDQRCTLCASQFVHDERRRGLFCQKHPNQEATRQFRVKFGRDIAKRFKTYPEAERFLDGLRYEIDKGTFDIRDYKANNPLGFTNLASQWLEVKKQEVRPGSLKNIRNYTLKACASWGNRNIKSIQYAEIEDFLHSLKLSDKSKSNARSCLHSFWTWLQKRRVLKAEQLPEFPEITYELGFRKTVQKDQQQLILDEVKRISYSLNPKIWLGIKWLATYISIRPMELINIQEKHIDLKSGFFFIPHPKEKRPKLVPLIDEDIDILKSLPRGLPNLYFFRHPSTVKGCKPGTNFGPRYLYKWWKQACANLGIEGVDLYGGTRHSSVIALTEFATPEQIRAGTMHTTNKAFERYYQVQKSDLKDLYTTAGTGYKTCQRPANAKTTTRKTK